MPLFHSIAYSAAACDGFVADAQRSGGLLTDRSSFVVDEKLATLKPRNWTPSRPGRSSGGTPTAGRLAALRSMGARSSRLPSCRRQQQEVDDSTCAQQHSRL